MPAKAGWESMNSILETDSVSVVMAVFNESSTLETSLRAALAQTSVWELVAVDDVFLVAPRRP